MTMMLGPSKAVLAGTLEEEAGAGNGAAPDAPEPAAPPESRAAWPTPPATARPTDASPAEPAS